MLNATNPEVIEFLTAWHENGRAGFERTCPNLADRYDDMQTKTAKERRKYIALDDGTSGRFLVDRLTHEVFTIKAYGVPGYTCGTIESLAMRFREGTLTQHGTRLYTVKA